MVSPVFGDYPFTASGSAQTIVHKKAANTTGEFDTEMLSMSLSGAIPEGLFMIRESPTLPSLGHSLIADLGGGIYGSSSSFDHVFTELLMEGSASWEPDFSYSGNIILVQAQPFITNQPQSQSVSAGSNVTFRVTAVGETPLTYQWQFNSTNISGASGTNYIRANSQSMDAGAYTVVVTNNFGSVTSAIATLTVTNANPDADGNGLPDAWEQQYFGHTGVDPNADADGEGMSNLREFLAGTNPTNAASVFRILSAVPTNNDVQVDWTTVGGHSYVLQSVTNLTMSFQDISPTNSVGGTNEGTTNYLHNGGATNPAGFYRVRLEP
jgi:hypothetical protein